MMLAAFRIVISAGPDPALENTTISFCLIGDIPAKISIHEGLVMSHFREKSRLPHGVVRERAFIGVLCIKAA